MVRSVTVTWWSSASWRGRVCRGVFGADAEVVHSACSAEAHLAGVIEPVIAQPVVAWRVSVAG